MTDSSPDHRPPVPQAAETSADDPRGRELSLALAQIRARMSEAAVSAGREAEDLSLIVVTKFHPAADVHRLAELGVRDVGENKVQEAAGKLEELVTTWPDDRPRVSMHFIGQLQSNKAAQVARFADAVHSVDRLKLVNALDRGTQRAREEGHRETVLPVLVQVDLREELGELGDQRSDHVPGSPEAVRAASERGGVAPASLLSLCDEVVQREHLRLAGVMCVAPLGADPEPVFARLADLAELVRAEYPDARWISAGMSADLEAAVTHGATHLRVGTAILGSRPSPR